MHDKVDADCEGQPNVPFLPYRYSTRDALLRRIVRRSILPHVLEARNVESATALTDAQNL